MTLSRDCVFPDLGNLFMRHDLTDAVEKEMLNVPANLKKMRRALDETRPPSIRIGPYCEKPYSCSFKSQCWSHIPEHSVFELGGVWAQTKFDLYARGKRDIRDIPLTESISRANPAQLQAVRTGQPVVSETRLAEFLSRIEFPAYFLDFETIGYAVPRFEGTRPYDQVPFQFSVHIVDHEGAAPRQIEFLATGAADPRNALTDALCQAIGPVGTIVAYHQSFEKKRIEELAAWIPSKSNELMAMLGRFIDLEDVFRKYYYHPDFHGSSSIKATLPALVPQMRYDTLEVNNGVAAQTAYLRMIDPRLPKEQAEAIAHSLRVYCGQDSLAMVELWRFLGNVARRRAA